jgi:hypothetical protein
MMKSLLSAIGILYATVCINAQNRVGIGTTTPLAALHVADSNVLFTGSSYQNPGNPPIEGAGVRMMWYADMAAFRAGGAASNEWNKDKIGRYSFAAGIGVEASGWTAIGLGNGSEAKGDYSTALGGGRALGNYSFAVGGTAIGFFSCAIGGWADGSSAIAIGNGARAKASDAVSIGSYNDTSDVPNPIIASPVDRIFQLGNGTYNVRKTALTVLRNGNMGIGTTTPASTLDVSGKTRTTQFQVGTGTTISNIQSATHTAGTSASGQLVTTITFPSAFSAAPKVIATVRHDPTWNVSDAFSVTVKSVSTTQAVLLIRRLDVFAAWNQNLLVDYIAIQ